MSLSISTRQKVTLADLWSTLPADVPVVFWDSCGLLDCLRIAVRYGKSYSDNFRLVEALVRNGKIVSVIPAYVRNEFIDNADDILAESERSQDAVIEKLQSLVECCANPAAFSASVSGLAALDVAGESKAIFESIVGNSYEVEEDDQFREFAHDRVISRTPPAHNKQEYKDCCIWGCVTGSANSRPDKSRKVFYICSNNRDYCTKDSKFKVLESQITADCAATGIEFLNNINLIRKPISELGIA